MERARSEHPFRTPLLFLLLLVPIGIALIYFHLVTRAFELLGISSRSAYLILVGSLVGSLINIPLTRRRIIVKRGPEYVPDSLFGRLLPIVYYFPPQVTDETVAINLGGAILPFAVSLYLITRSMAIVPAALAATLVVAAIAKLFARPEPRVGITLPPLVAPLVAALAAHLLAGWMGAPSAAPVAYIAGTMGTLIGADLLNLPAILSGELAVGPEEGPPVLGGTETVIMSIGGAGVFDGVFLTGILAPLLAG